MIVSWTKLKLMAFKLKTRMDQFLTGIRTNCFSIKTKADSFINKV